MLRTTAAERLKLLKAGNIEGDRTYTLAQRTLHDALTLIHYRLGPKPTSTAETATLQKALFTNFGDFSKALNPRYDGTNDQMKVYLPGRIRLADVEANRLLANPKLIPDDLRAGLDFLYKAR